MGAGYNATSANNSNFLGQSAGYSATNAYLSNFLGCQAGYFATNAFGSNFLGLGAGYFATNASYSNLIGYQAGLNSLGSIGSNNIVIGTNITLPVSASSAINIGGLIFGTGSYNNFAGNPVSGSADGRIGINQPNPSYSLDVNGTSNFSGNSTISGSLTITQNLSVLGSSSILYITASSLNISTNLITVNTSTPAVRFGGLAVYDSGSLATGLTGSILWDSQNNRWIYSNPSGSSYDGGMFISGPRNTSGLGNEQGTTLNALMKGQGTDHITSSLLTEDGTTFTIGLNTSISGNVSVTGSVFATSFTGSLSGTSTSASYAVSASYWSGSIASASYAFNATSASYAVTASSLNPITNSYVILSQVSASLNFVDDTAAAAGGVPVGGLYRNGNFILIRLS